MKRWLSLALPVGLLFVLFVVTGVRGIDFGFHWDEDPLHMAPARNMAHTGVLLPHEYTYMGLSKWLVLLPAWPRTLGALIASGGEPEQARTVLQRIVDSPRYLLDARCVFVVVSALAIFWVYGAALALRRSRWEAFLAACGIGLSWEFAYHSRWVAIDCTLTQFSALTLFMLALFQRERRELWLFMGAIAAGCGMGSKQPGVFLLVPVFVTSVLTLPLKRPLRQIGRGLLLGLTAFAAFVITTPGFLLEPFTFISGVKAISAIYGAGHGQFSAASAWQHWGWVWTYLTVEYFSPYKIASIVMSGFALLGLVQWLRRDARFLVPFLLFPPLFLFVFAIKYPVMICRNYLQFAPILCLLAARGVTDLYSRLPYKSLQTALVTALAALGFAQAVFLVRAAESIRHYDPDSYVREAIAYVEAHPKKQFRVSERVRSSAARSKLAMPPNVTRAPDGQAVVMFGRADMGSPWAYKENSPWLTDAVFGPLEVNFNWYAVWGGMDRVVVMPIETARLGEVPLAQ